MNSRNLALILPALLVVFQPVAAQESDLEVKRNYELARNEIRTRIDSATTVAAMDSLLARINALELQYAARSVLLDRALYPEDFAGSIRTLRDYHTISAERVYLLEKQGITIAEYEARITALTGRLDTLTTENRRLLAELGASRESLAQLRERVRRLSNAMLARDRLIFALVDTIFLPYDKDMQQVTDAQKETIARKLLKANIVARLYDIATDNIKFVEVTSLQGKDFRGAFDQLAQFRTKWDGLREKLSAVALTGDAATGGASTVTAPAGRTTGKGAGKEKPAPAPAAEQPGLYVDSALAQWETGLRAALWTGIARAFSANGVSIRPFTDGPSFATAVQAYVDSARADGRDATAFTTSVWKETIDKEWREVLEREDVLGKTQYASLDKLVSELGEKRFDMKFILYVLLAAAAAGLIYWIFGRKPKPAATK